MRKPFRLFAGLLLAAGLAAGPALAADDGAAALQIENPWIRATPPGARAAGGFLTIRNTGSAADRLLGGSSPLGPVEVHTMTMENGVMRMRPLPDGLEIPAGATVELKPGAEHLMFVDLPHPVAMGSPVPVALQFEKAGELPVELQVMPVGARSAEPDDGGHGGGGHGTGGQPRH